MDEDMFDEIWQVFLTLMFYNDKVVNRAKLAMNYVEPCYFCTFCCRNSRILVTIPEIIQILQVTRKKFDDLFKIEDNNLSVSIKTNEDDLGEKCLFLEGEKCTIYRYRPFQCRTYPIIFNSLSLNLPTYWRSERGRFYFRCQRDHHRKCRMWVRTKDFIEITLLREDFLYLNYQVQSELIKKGIFKEAIEKFVETTKVVRYDVR